MAFKTPKAGDIVGYHWHSVIERVVVPMIVDRVDKDNPKRVSGIALTSRPDLQGWNAPVKAISNAEYGSGHGQWTNKPGETPEASDYFKRSQAAVKIKSRGKPEAMAELDG